MIPYLSPRLFERAAVALVIIVLAVVSCGRRAPDSGEEAGYWKAIAEARMRAVVQLIAQRDSAIAAAAEADTAVTRAVVTLWEPAKLAALSDTALARDPAVRGLIAAGDGLRDASENLQARHRVAIALAKGVGDSLEGVVQAKDQELAAVRRIRQPWIEASAAALWNFDTQSPVVRGDVGLRIREHVRLVAGVDHRFGTILVPGETRKLAGVRVRFR